MVMRLSAVAAKSSDHLRQWDKQDCSGFSACSLLELEKSSSRLRYHAERSSHANHFSSMGLNFTLRILCASSAHPLRVSRMDLHPGAWKESCHHGRSISQFHHPELRLASRTRSCLYYQPDFEESKMNTFSHLFLLLAQVVECPPSLRSSLRLVQRNECFVTPKVCSIMADQTLWSSNMERI